MEGVDPGVHIVRGGASHTTQVSVKKAVEAAKLYNDIVVGIKARRPARDDASLMVPCSPCSR